MPGTPSSSGPAEIDAIRAEIDATREHLGRTVDELGDRFDVRRRVRQRVQEGIALARDIAVETYRESPPVVLSVGATLAAGIAGLVLWRKKR